MNYERTITQGYCAPELSKKTNPKLDNKNKEYDPKCKINIEKALSYTCGMLIDHIINYPNFAGKFKI